MKKNNYLRQILLAVVMFVNISAFAITFEVDGIYYSVDSYDDYGCQVAENSSSNNYSGDIVIPDTVVYNNMTYVVTGIGKEAFYHCDKLRSLVIPNTVTTIGNSAFWDCSITSIELPNSVTTIGDYAFFGCSITSIELPNSVTTIGKSAFSMSRLRNIIFPNSLAAIGEDAFSKCKFTSIKLPSTLRTLGQGAFEGCEYLKSVEIPRGIRMLPLSVFSRCTSLEEVVIPNTVTVMQYELANTGFEGCFTGCTSLKRVIFEDGEKNITLQRMDTYGNSRDKNEIFDGDPIEEVYYGREIENIFHWLTTLKKVVFGKNVKTIGYQAFSGCTELKEILVPDNVAEIDVYSFRGCENLENIYLGSGLKKIETGAFDKCYNLKKIYLFSRKLTNAKFSRSNISKIYVPDVSIYQTILGDYNLESLGTFMLKDPTSEYSGKNPEVSYLSNVQDKDIEVSLDTRGLGADTGVHADSAFVIFKKGDWQSSLAYVCNYSISKAPLKVYANNAQKYYGEENPQLTCSYVGFKNGETNDVLITQPKVFCNVTKDSYAGTYPIYCSGAEAKNYDITYENGFLTVAKALQNIEWEQDFGTAVVGDEILLTASCNSGLPLKYKSSDQSVVLISSKGGKQYAYILKEGVAGITAYQSGDANHEEAEEMTKVIRTYLTGINDIKFDGSVPVVIYDVEGHKLDKPQKGINIINGKKVLVK